MKLLLPTDFSKLSKIAINYSAKLAIKLNADIILLNAVFINAPPRAQSALKTNQILDAMVDHVKQEFVLLTNEIKQEVGDEINISYKIVKGFPVEEIVESFALHNEVDFIIMGTKGASGLKKVLLGSNAAAVISNSSIPVITVPEFARFNDIKQIVYASDLLAVSQEMKILIEFAKLFNANIHLLHVISPNSTKKIDQVKIKEGLVAKYKFPQITIHIALNDDLVAAFDEYMADVKADMLAMFTHTPTFFEKLFNTSVTREMVFHSWIPLLTIKKRI